MGLIDCPNCLRPIHDGRYRFNATLRFLLDGDMPPRDLDNQVAGRRRTRLGGRGDPIVLRQQVPHCRCHPFDLRMIIHAAGVAMQLPQVALRLSGARQGPVFTVPLR